MVPDEKPQILPVLLLLALCAGSVCSASENGESQLTQLKVIVEDVDGKRVALGRIHVGQEDPHDPGFHINRDVGPNGECLFELQPATYGVHWNTKDRLSPVRVEVNGITFAGYPKFVKTSDSGDEEDRVRVISGRVVGAEVRIDDEPATVRIVVPSRLEGRRVTGIVVDNQGAPIANLWLALYRGDAMNCARCAITDDDGRFSFISREFPIRLVPRDRTGLWLFQPEELAVTKPPVSPLGVVGRPRTHERLAGIVVDGRSGEAIPGLWVEYEQDCLGASIEGTVKTDRAGRFAASCYPECGMALKVRDHKHNVSGRATAFFPSTL